MKGIELYGKDWKKVQQHVGTRTSAQSRSHAQKVLSGTKYGRSTSNINWTPMKELVPLDDGFTDFTKERPVKANTIKRKATEFERMEVSSGSKSLNNMADSPKQNFSCSKELNFDSSPYKRIWKEEDHENINKVDFHLAENDEVSQQLLKKLTTPKQPSRVMSFSIFENDLPRLKLGLDSDIDSIEDNFGQVCELDLIGLNDMVMKNSGDFDLENFN